MGDTIHPCRLGALVREVGAYLAGPDATEVDQRHAAAAAFRNAQADFEQFQASMCDGTALIATELTIEGARRDLHSVATHLPSPLTLLLVCARNCEEGDRVALLQRTAKCGELRQEARWPFGLEEAERLTRPASLLFAALQDAGPDAVRRHERAIGRRVLVTERRHESHRVRVPRLRRWVDERVRGVELRFGRRALRAGAAPIAA